MKYLIKIILLAFLPIMSWGNNSLLYCQLDSTLMHRNDYVAIKERRLNEMKLGAKYVRDAEGKLQLYEALAKGYLAYVYDSAMVYTQLGMSMAQKSRNKLYFTKFLLLRANLLISRGFYAEAKDILQQLQVSSLDTKLISNYYHTLYILYNNWEAYCEGNEFSALYKERKLQYLRKAIESYPQKDATFYYLNGELSYFMGASSQQACYYYKKAMSMEKDSNRLYAMSAFALSNAYAREHAKVQQEKYLVLAAISDVKSATKENLALQDIALFLYQNNNRQLKKAQEYIKLSLEDASSYNNRLRRLEISSKLQLIMTAYTDQIKSRNIWLIVALLSILVLLLGMVVSSVFIRKKNRQLRQKQELLGASAEQMSQLNQRLEYINRELKDTNKKREILVKVYIDLCYKYIERLGKLRTLVVRKIKTNQQKELLSMLSSSKTSDKENLEFLQQFDKAFLTLYPSFVKELNGLLDSSVNTWKAEKQEMSPMLRVAALIRLGIMESSKIAGILSYSPQTIYNYRSMLKNHARNKEHFEEDLQKLCTVMN